VFPFCNACLPVGANHLSDHMKTTLIVPICLDASSGNSALHPSLYFIESPTLKIMLARSIARP
jgi:hypothetical protein